MHKHSSNNKSEIKSIKVNNVTSTDEDNIYQQLNEYFSTIGWKVQEKIPHTFTNDNLSNNMIESQSINSFKYYPVSVQEWKMKSCL